MNLTAIDVQEMSYKMHVQDEINKLQLFKENQLKVSSYGLSGLNILH